MSLSLKVHQKAFQIIIGMMVCLKNTSPLILPLLPSCSTLNGLAAHTLRWGWWKPSCLWTSWWTSPILMWTSPTPSMPSRLLRASAKHTQTKVPLTGRATKIHTENVLGRYTRLVSIWIHCPCADWFQLVGLIHDVGKTMALWNEPQVRGRFNTGCLNTTCHTFVFSILLTLFLWPLFDPFCLLIMIIIITINPDILNFISMVRSNEF